MSLSVFCLVLALVLFLLATLKVGDGKFNLTAGGLFFLTLAQVLGGFAALHT